MLFGAPRQRQGLKQAQDYMPSTLQRHTHVACCQGNVFWPQMSRGFKKFKLELFLLFGDF